MATRLQLRGDTLANWLMRDPVLMEREVALIASNPDKPKSYDLKKVGDGRSRFSELPMLGYECLQDTGDSQQFPMSQKAVTENFIKEATRFNAELEKKASTEYVDSYLKELQNTVFPLQVYLSLDKTLLEFTGNDQTVKVSYSIKRKDALVTPSSLVLTINGMMKDIDIKSSDTVSVEVHKEGESMVVLTAKYDELVKSATAKVIMVLPIYFGFGTSEIDVAIADNKLEPRTSAVGIYEKTSAKDNVNFIILVPKTLPRLTSFTMGGAPCVMDESSVVITGKNYYMYKTAAVYMTGATLKVQAG